MTQAKKISKASSYFFLLGFIASKIQYLPLAFISSIINLVALGFYFAAYGLWFISSHFQPSQKEKNNEWYGFAQFKEQYLYAATIGLIASTISMMAFFFPVLLPPAAWLFFCSNMVWSIGEYHKLNNPPETDENYSHSYQKSSLSYSITMTAITLTTAISATLIFLFPPITISVIIASTITCMGLGILAAEYWLDYTFGDHKKTSVINHSYNHMQESLGPAQTNHTTHCSEPYHGNEILYSNQIVATKENHDGSELSMQTCTPGQ